MATKQEKIQKLRATIYKNRQIVTQGCGNVCCTNPYCKSNHVNKDKSYSDKQASMLALTMTKQKHLGCGSFNDNDNESIAHEYFKVHKKPKNDIDPPNIESGDNNRNIVINAAQVQEEYEQRIQKLIAYGCTKENAHFLLKKFQGNVAKAIRWVIELKGDLAFEHKTDVGPKKNSTAWTNLLPEHRYNVETPDGWRVSKITDTNTYADTNDSKTLEIKLTKEQIADIKRRRTFRE
eukprot:394358_1